MIEQAALLMDVNLNEWGNSFRVQFEELLDDEEETVQCSALKSCIEAIDLLREEQMERVFLEHIRKMMNNKNAPKV